jgi:hypothetical protein
MLDQAHMRSFVDDGEERRISCTLAELPDEMPNIMEWAGVDGSQTDSIQIRTSQRWATDPLFNHAVLQKLSPEVVQALEDSGTPVPPRQDRQRPTARQTVTFTRFRLYE